jgi:hypothetical protein
LAEVYHAARTGKKTSNRYIMLAHRFALLLLVFAVTTASADSIFLGDGDVYFMTQPMCGFQIRGNHQSIKVPRPEWDINIDEIVTEERRIAGISIGAFDVTSKDRKVARKPRAPITAMTFWVDGQPLATQIVGKPNAANAVRAMMESEPAARIFEAFANRKLIKISLRYRDGTADELQVRGWSDDRKFGSGKNNFFEECRRGVMPLQGIKQVVP